MFLEEAIATSRLSGGKSEMGNVMNEDEWLVCADPESMVTFLLGKKNDRKLRLFSCAFCRSIWTLIGGKCFRNAVEVAEQFADGFATKKDLASAKKESGAALERSGLNGATGTPQNALGCAWSTTRTPLGSAAMYPLWVFTESPERMLQLSLLRDIFGNPFRPLSLDPSWLTRKVVAVAQRIYDNRDFDLLPRLADAFEGVGCHDTEILSHCRSSGPHVRGCWALDLVLGKE
jgi:hypothetical protein